MIAVLRPRGPFSLAASARGAGGGTRRLRGGVLELALRPGGAPARARAVQRPDGALEVAVDEGEPEAVVAEARAVLGLDRDTGPFRERFAGDPLIGDLVRRHPGLRPACRGTVAQALVAAVAGQLVAWRAAERVERRVVARAASRTGDLRLPPTGAEIAALSPAALAACGLGARRAAALARLARSLDLEALRARPSAAVAARLAREPGLGPWSAGVVALYGLGRYDVGLVGDLGLLRVAGRLRGRPAAEADTAALLAPYGEWAGLASAYLLRHPWAASPTPARRRAAARG